MTALARSLRVHLSELFEVHEVSETDIQSGLSERDMELSEREAVQRKLGPCCGHLTWKGIGSKCQEKANEMFK